MPEPIESRGATQGHYVDEFVEENILLSPSPSWRAPSSNLPHLWTGSTIADESRQSLISTGSLYANL